MAMTLFPTMPLKRFVDKTNAGEVIDKNYWGSGSEMLYTCALNPLESNYEKFPSWKRTTSNDLLLTRNGTPYVHKPITGSIYSNVVQRIVLNDEIDRNFAEYAIQDAANKMHGYGVSIQSLNYQMWKELPIYSPPIGVQIAIAKYLDNETGKIKRLIERQQDLIRLLDERRKAAIVQAVTKGLNPSVKMQATGLDWISEIPAHWKILPVKRIFKLITEAAPENNNEELLSLFTGIGVKPRREMEERGNKASSTDGYWIVKKGDIVVNKLLAWMGAIGVSNYDGVTSPAYDILRKHIDLNSNYFDYLFRSGLCLTEFKKYSRGIMEMRLRLYFEELGQLKMPFPPLDEQNRICEYLDSSLSKYDKLVEKSKVSIKLLEERYASLISAAVTGKIDIREVA